MTEKIDKEIQDGLGNINFPKPVTFYQRVEQLMDAWERQTKNSSIESASVIRTFADTIYKERIKEIKNETK